MGWWSAGWGQKLSSGEKRFDSAQYGIKHFLRIIQNNQTAQYGIRLNNKFLFILCTIKPPLKTVLYYTMLYYYYIKKCLKKVSYK